MTRREQIKAKFGGRCAYCGVELGAKWHVDHVKPVWRESKYVRGADGRGRMVSTGKMFAAENDRADNIFPACIPCNIDKGVESVEAWRKWLQSNMVETMRRNVANFRHAERFGRVTISDAPLVFWFEGFRDDVDESGEV